VHDDAGVGDGPGRRPARAAGLRHLHSATRRLHPSPPHRRGPQDQARPCGQASAGAGAARPSPNPPRLRAAVELCDRPWRRARAPRPAMAARVELRDRPWRRARAPRPAMAARVELRDRPWRCARAPRPAMAARTSSTSPTVWCVAAGERRKGGGR
jgi:hypothetical protein